MTYGVIDSKDSHVDVSNTERGAKQYATLHGYDTVSARGSWNAFKIAKKVNGKWVKLTSKNSDKF